nr:piggyBac transposable element-derived protein 2-like [Leptinotarsa decemlineata]
MVEWNLEHVSSAAVADIISSMTPALKAFILLFKALSNTRYNSTLILHTGRDSKINPEIFRTLSCSEFYGTRFKSLAPAVNDICSLENTDEVHIVIIPPNDDPQTDDEEIDDDNIQGVQTRLPRDVASEVELHYLGDDQEELEFDDEGWNIPLSHVRQKILDDKTQAESFNVSEPEWTNDVIDIGILETTGYIDHIEVVKSELSNMTPDEVFERLWDKSVWNLLVRETNTYSTQKNDHEFFVSETDMKIFIGILLLSGYHRLPHERLYWCVDDDVRVSFVANVISRNRFQEIKKYIHLSNNNNLDKNDL